MPAVKFQSEEDPLPWQDVACDRTGQWTLADGEELYPVEKSRSKESGTATLTHTLHRGGLTQGRADVQLADDVLDVVVRPRGEPPTPPVPPSPVPPSSVPPSSTQPPSAGPPPSERDENRRTGGATPEDAFERMFHAIGDEDYTLACRYVTTGQKLGSDLLEDDGTGGGTGVLTFKLINGRWYLLLN